MDFAMVVKLLGGIALFLFGMKLMGDGLKSVAGNKLELILYRLSNTAPKGVLLGTGVTAVIQSSAATSVMVVGFVNSGMMKLRQAVSVILGAILGTSITGWIICLNYIDGASGTSGILSSSTLTGVIAVAGIVLVMFIKNPTAKKLGGIMMGFAVLMFGMSAMSSAMSSLGETEGFRNVLTSLSNPALGIVVGLVFTAVLQSASAAVGIIQALSVSGSMSVDSAVPLLLGVAIGASVPVLLSALGATVNGKRASLIYPITTTLSAAVCAAVFYIGDTIFGFPFLDWTANPFLIALLNTILRLCMILILLPFSDVIESLVTSIVREKKGGDDDAPLLEEMFISHPALAVDQSRTAMCEMARRSRTSLITATGILNAFDPEAFEKVEKLEASVDKYEDGLGTYLVKLTGHELTGRQNKDVSIFLHTLSDFERISDHAQNIAESAKEIKDKKLTFSEGARSEMTVIANAVNEIVSISVDAFLNSDIDAAKKVEPLEEVIDELCDKAKARHIERLQTGECTIVPGFVLNDLLSNFERVSDHCSNIAAALIEIEADEFDTHRYLGAVKQKHTEDFEQHYNEFKTQYFFD
ncbi:MAG: Na/Pi cotransporter family protein [Clostridia bacterium]|nr:Na/Pi cotransporter family protein [Clostridia bacterium]